MKTRSINNEINTKIAKMQPGKVFDYSIFKSYQEKPQAVAKALSRLEKEKKIQRLEKGVYYIPLQSKYGILKPSEEKVINALKQKEKGMYETGLNVYNKLGLTSQVPNSITLATKIQKPPKTAWGINIQYTKKDFEINRYDSYLLQLLDALKDCKYIPDNTPDGVIRVIRSKIKELSRQKIRHLILASYNYPPFVRAILGAIIELDFLGKESAVLKESLNPLTKYAIPIKSLTLPNKAKWGIK
ncbi:MAG: hypothetical protein KGY69_19000 [Bacteroidales bacterium]|nr:hypothetical protein [Candidatus Cloacimonadota bacterium]MBS3772346.1 hypothetical protein [Bacteroidales bacterium]